MSGEGTVVCVTGGSGYIASWLVKLLLHRGYTVKATVRDPAEDAAWKFAEESGISLVTMHPGWTIGPLLQPTLNITVEMLLNHIKELETFPGNIDKFVDVRDVSNAHIQAFEKASASGRYCLVGKLGHISEIVKIVHEHYPTLHLPESKPFMPEYEVSKEKAKALGMDFTPLETTVKDIIESLKEKCYLLV